MAGSTSSQVKHLRDHASHKAHQITNSVAQRLNGHRSTKAKSRSSTTQVEKHCRNWSILSNIAALVSVGSAVYSLLNKNTSIWNKRRFW